VADFSKYDVNNLEELVRNVKHKTANDFAESLSTYLDVGGATKYGNKDAEQQARSYDTLMKYEIANGIDDILDQIKDNM